MFCKMFSVFKIGLKIAIYTRRNAVGKPNRLRSADLRQRGLTQTPMRNETRDVGGSELRQFYKFS